MHRNNNIVKMGLFLGASAYGFSLWQQLHKIQHALRITQRRLATDGYGYENFYHAVCDITGTRIVEP